MTNRPPQCESRPSVISGCSAKLRPFELLDQPAEAPLVLRAADRQAEVEVGDDPDVALPDPVRQLPIDPGSS